MRAYLCFLDEYDQQILAIQMGATFGASINSCVQKVRKMGTRQEVLREKYHTGEDGRSSNWVSGSRTRKMDDRPGKRAESSTEDERIV